MRRVDRASFSFVGEFDEWRFCPRCREAIDSANGHVMCGACGFRAWANPAPGTEAVIVDDAGRVLLGRRAFDPAAGRWDLPGGFLEEDEDPITALRREVREETGLDVDPTTLVGFYLEPYENRVVLCITWLARVVGGDERAGDDLVELQWFERNAIPYDELAFGHYAQALSDAFRNEHA
jgi:8-oxo-dGTP diphosphatase